ncbi:DUF4105 domain-containing protein [Thalassotalea crassostreae]|uniref:Lnb N-terminal periplasmic domain-containing protein n=1 Tax=Thalassotalea crassostreae TaxID=1763536 RepID=UPI000838475D|nr:DUF4105 domain-containing protein [Thalassotalea crassostreae]
MNRANALITSIASLCIVNSLMVAAPVAAKQDDVVVSLNEQQLSHAFDDYWLTLLYYQQDGDEYESFVDDSRFFFAEQGKTNPGLELSATVNAFIREPNNQCLFPARTMWLREALPELYNKLPQTNCEEYTLWRKDLNTETVVLVYASSQLNSPSSMYGHTFIRFDPKNVENNSTLLSHAINFGANIPANENGLVYAIRGLGGGYPGNFASNPYFEKIKEYNRAENRDLWEYKLDLNEQEIDIMLAHVWELRGINFDYYFFDENCSYRLLELLDIARPGLNVTDDFPGVSIPIDTVRAVRDKGMITDVHYRPSARTHLDNQLNKLPVEQRQMAIALSNDITVRDSEHFKQLSVEQQTKIVHASYRLIRYLTNKEERSKDVAKRSFQLLRMMRAHAAIQPPEPERPYRPDLGHETTLFSIKAGESHNKAFVDFTYRASYHDLIDNIDGYDNGMSLNMGRITLRARDESLQLQNLELLDITSLSPRKDYLAPWSWLANIGMERQWTQGKDELVVQARGGGGLSYEVFADDRLFLMATGRIEYNEGLENIWAVAPGITSGYLKTWQHGKTLFSVSQYQFIDDITRSEIKLEHNWAIDNQSGLRIHLMRNINDDVDYDEFAVSYRHYF